MANRIHPIVYLTSAFVLGILLAFKASVIFIFITICSIIFLLTFFFKKPLGIIAIVLFLLLGFTVGSFQNNQQVNNPVKNLAEQKVVVEGLVVSDVVKKNYLYHFKLAVKKVNKKKANLLISTYSKESKQRYGHFVRIKGRVKLLEVDLNAEPLLILLDSSSPQILGSNSFWSRLGDLRLWIKQSLGATKSQAAAFTYAMMTGQNAELSPVNKANIAASGLAHIWSVSGLHTGFLTLILLILFRLIRLRAGLQLIGIIVCLFLFAAFTGFKPPVIRASIMASWLSLAYLLGRKNNWIPSIATAALITLAIDPAVLFSPSFQLSYAAVLSLLIFSPKIASFFQEVPSMLKKALSVSIGVQILSLPLVGFYYGQLPVYSSLANILAVPIAALAFNLTIASLVLKAAGLDFTWLPNFLSSLILQISAFFSNLSGSTLEPSFWLLGLAAAGVLLLTVLLKFKKPVIKFSYLIIFILAFAAFQVWWPAAQGLVSGKNLSVEFLDVGQGDASLIVGPKKEKILIDGGPRPYQIRKQLIKRKIRSLDLVVASHADADHIGGLPSVLQDFEVKAVLDNGYPKESSIYRRFLRIVKAKKIRYILARKGQKIKLGTLNFRILSPPEGFIKGGDEANNNSVVMHMTFGKTSFLFTGDAGIATEKVILQSGTPRVTVLKVAHHGSANNSSTTFLKAVRPKVAVISAGKNNSYGHPAPSLLGRLRAVRAKIYRTDKSSDIKVMSSNRHFQVYE